MWWALSHPQGTPVENKGYRLGRRKEAEARSVAGRPRWPSPDSGPQGSCHRALGVHVGAPRRVEGWEEDPQGWNSAPLNDCKVTTFTAATGWESPGLLKGAGRGREPAQAGREEPLNLNCRVRWPPGPRSGPLASDLLLRHEVEAVDNSSSRPPPRRAPGGYSRWGVEGQEREQPGSPASSAAEQDVGPGSGLPQCQVPADSPEQVRSSCYGVQSLAGAS